MTREKMIDKAVKQAMRRSTMAIVLNSERYWREARADPEAWLAQGYSPLWLEDDEPFRQFPKRLLAIRRNFARSIADAQRA